MASEISVYDKTSEVFCCQRVVLTVHLRPPRFPKPSEISAYDKTSEVMFVAHCSPETSEVSEGLRDFSL